jgi:hypothetical protein
MNPVVKEKSEVIDVLLNICKQRKHIYGVLTVGKTIQKVSLSLTQQNLAVINAAHASTDN